MKILHLDFDDLDSPQAGGQAVRTFEINKRLMKRGHEVSVVTLNYPGAKNLIREGVFYERIGSKKFPFNFISYLVAIPYILRKHTFDLVVEENIPPFSFGLSPLYTSNPVISQVQSFFAREASKKYHLPFWRGEKYAARVYQNFIVLTETMAQKIRILNPKARIEIIANGLNSIGNLEKLSSEDLNVRKYQPFILFLGRIDFFHKGLDLLLQSAKLLSMKAPDVKIVLCGEGKDGEILQKILEKEHLKNVEYKGKVQGKEKEEMLRQCSFLVLPSRFEIFPMTILEGAAYGKTTVCFDIENLHELMKQKIGMAVKPFDIKVFAEAITYLWENKSEQGRLGKNAYFWAKELTWDKLVVKQEKFYMDVLQGKH